MNLKILSSPDEEESSNQINTRRIYASHQLKLSDSKCRSSVEQEVQIDATSCLIFLGPLTRTPMLDPSQPESISAKE